MTQLNIKSFQCFKFIPIRISRFLGLSFLFLLFFCNAFSQGPVITYTPLSNTCVEGARTISATITDPDGVPTTGAGVPYLYWKLNSGAYTGVPGVFNSATSKYDFTFAASSFAGCLIYYYIVAQDNTGLTSNVSVSPSIGASDFSISPPSALIPPTNPNVYVVQQTLSGTFTVGVGQNYATITDALSAYSNSCLNGPVTFLLTDATYGANEVFPIIIFNSQSSAVNTLTVKPNTNIIPTITGNAPDALFKFNGTDYITFDGSNAGNTTRSLTIQNTNTGPVSSVFWLSSFNATDGCNYNVIKNCKIYGNSPTTTFAGIAMSNGAIITGNSDAPNSNNSFINNDINSSYYSIFINGSISGESNNNISNNTLGSTQTGKKTGYRSVFVSNQTNFTISKNLIPGLNSTSYSGSEADATAGIVISGSCTGGIINGNNIYDIRNTSSSGAATYGISLQTNSSTSGIKIYNNFIHSVYAYGKATNIYENGMGIAIISGGGYGIYYNSIFLNLNQTAIGSTTACLFIGPSATGTIDVRNNIFANRQTFGNRYSLYNSLTRSIFNTVNYNDYFTSGYIGFITDPIANLADWQAATLADGNSVVVDPIFAITTGTSSAINLHLQPSSTLNDQGIPISGITVDFDDSTRSATNTDIGADEFTPPNCINNFGGTVSAISSSIICVSGQAVLACSGFDYGAGMSYQWESSLDNFATAGLPISGETNPTTANPPPISVSTYFRLRVRCGSGANGYSNSILITVKNPSITSTTPASRCGTGPLTLGAVCNAGSTIQWYENATGGVPVGTGNSFTTPTLSATKTYYAEPAFIGNVGYCGPANPSAVAGAVSYQLTPWNVYFDVIQATTLATIDVYPNNSGEAFKIDIYNSNNISIGSTTFVTNVSGGATAQVVPVNVFLLPGNDYYIYLRSDDPIYPMGTGLNRNIAGANYPYTSSDIAITGNAFVQTYYMCLYNWKFQNGCTVSRVPVNATIGSPADFTLNGTTSICAGSNTILTASSTNSSYVYSWSPSGYTGAANNVSPTVDTRYTVTAFDGTCTNVKTIDVVVSEAPTPIIITNNAANPYCNGSVVTLTATGGSIPSIVTILNEKFEGTGLPFGWDTVNLNPTQVATINGKWTQRSSVYISGSTAFKSNDSSKFYLANSSASGSATLNTSLRTPRLDFTGYDSVSISFWQHYSSFLAPDSINLEYSRTPSLSTSGTGTNGATWTTIWKTGPSTSGGTAGGTIGTSSNFVQRVINLTPFLTRTSTRDTFYLRFRYVGKNNFWWAIDNVKIVGRGGSPITWTPVTGLFDNVACTNPYNPSIYNSIVYTKPTAQVTYTAISGTPNGCSSSESVTLNPRLAVTSTMSGNTTVCPNSTANISIILTGKAPWKFYVKNVTTNLQSPILTANSSPYIYTTPAIAATSVFKVFTLKDSNNIGCSANTASLLLDSVKVTVGALKASIAGSNAICSGSPTNLSVQLTGTPPWRLQYMNGATPVVITGINSSPYTLVVNPTSSTTYTLDSLRDGGGCSAIRDSLTGAAVISINPTGTAAISGNSTICAGSSATITTTLTGTPPWNFTYTNGTTPVTVTAVNASPYTFTVTPSTASTYSISSMTDGNGCTTPASDLTGAAVVSFGTPITGALTGTASICENGSTNLSVALTGIAPWSVTYTSNGGNPVTVNNINASPYSILVSPVSNTTYSLTAVTDGNGCTANASDLSSNAIITVTTSTTTSWTGISSNWFDGNNWCGGIPTNVKDVVIPSGTPFNPVISGAQSAFTRNITLNNGATITIANDGTLSVSGNTINNGTITNNGIYKINGSTDQGFPGGTTGIVSKMNILEINKASGAVNFNKKFAITDTGVLRVTKATTINISDTITMKSTLVGTSRIDSIASTAVINYLGTGCFTVERFIPSGINHGKSWQLLSTPTFGQTIKQAWQEGATSVSNNPNPGYGTTITSNLSGATTSLGFDFYTPSGATMKVYDYVTNNYIGVPNTSTTIANPKGYMFFVRGDRSILTSAAAAIPVTLRTTGKIYYGVGPDSALSLTVPAGKFQSAGNPYASPIDFQQVLTTSTGLNATFYIWDPALQSGNGLGAFQTISSFNLWKPVPGGTINYDSAIVYSKIQSGQGFFVYSDFGGQLKFNEKNKVSGQRSVLRANDATLKMLKLYLRDSQSRVLDGNIVAFDSNSQYAVDENDALKLLNFGENTGVFNNGRLLAIDARTAVNADDTIQYHITNLRQQHYTLAFVPTSLQHTDLMAFLVDKYADVEWPISFTDTTIYHFDIDNQIASRQADRFYVVFKTVRTVPVTFLGVNAKRISDLIRVKWDVTSELSINYYEVEKSTDGIRFNKISTQTAIGNDGANHTYQFDDHQLFNGDIFYRIRSYATTGEERISNIAKIHIVGQKSEIKILLNPIANNQVNIGFINMNTGNYAAMIYDHLGQLVFNESISHNGDAYFVHSLMPKYLLASGIYTLKIVNSSSGQQFLDKITIK